jgi:serine/threonine protein kinase/Flp pilus assembly protein TadD
MNPSGSRDANRDERLGEVLAEWLEAVEQGRPPDESVYLRRYPEFAEELRQCFTNWKRFPRPRGAADRPRALPEPLLAESGVLGDFRIVREVGRGGMGVVYEAEQVSLGRRVALKVLPLVATLDARQLQRFQNEARAAAQLHHSNIVPVFAVGSERGVHYYAMQYIDGHSLADLIAGLRTGSEWRNARHAATVDAAAGEALTKLSVATAAGVQAAGSALSSASDDAYFRRAAELGVQAAEALDHAHQAGIVHRDIKPANLLVDQSGRLWITDFGLAQVQGDARMTASGEMLGTLRYMSPEQALTRRAVLDHRTDVYSLGATLYELLTLEPVFRGMDRQELLRQITFDEPRPPRRLNKAIPAELETIIGKALEKDPGDRYGTAQELADDLRRFLEHQPIRARRPTFLERARKWLRRHQAVAWASSAGLAVAVATLIVSTVLIWQEKERTATAYQAEARQRQEADTKRRLARQAVDKMYTQVATKWLADEPQLTALQRDFLKEALQFYQDLSSEEADDPTVRQETARAQRYMGEILAKLERRPEAEEAFHHAITAFQQLIAEDPGNPGDAHDLAIAYTGLGTLFHHAGRAADAEKAYRQGMDIEEQLVRAHPGQADYQHRLGILYMDLGTVCPVSEAEQFLQRGRELFEQLLRGSADNTEFHTTLGGILNNLAIKWLQKGKPEQACRLLEQAIEHQQAALRVNPRSKTALGMLRNHYSILSEDVLRALGEHREALKMAQEGLVVAQKLAAEFPEVPRYEDAVADSQHGLGRILAESGQLDEAEKALRQARTLREKAVKRSPGVSPLRGLLGETCTSLGDVLSRTGRDREALVEYRRALELDPRNAAYMVNVAWALVVPGTATRQDAGEAADLARKAIAQTPRLWNCWNTLGAALYRSGQWQEALDALEKAVSLQEKCPPPPYLFMAMAHWHLGHKEEAIQRYREVTQRMERTGKQEVESSRLLAECAALLGLREPSTAKQE